MATNKARQTVKQLATKGDVKSARILAKEVVRSEKQKDRLSVSKARLGSISSQLDQQLGTQILHYNSKLQLNSLFSHVESNRIPAEINRNYETIEFAHQAPANQSDDARNEHGDDQGQYKLYLLWF
jgi:hypothetical protein